MEPRASDALIVVDVQNDLCPGGAIPVPAGDSVVRPINRLIPLFEHVAYTRDYHPQDHCSFSDSFSSAGSGQPVHCVMDSPGAEFHGGLIVPTDARIFDKGVDADSDETSVFELTAFEAFLRKRGITRVFVAGLPLEGGVRHTALGAIGAGLEVFVVEDACRSVTDDGNATTREELRGAGVLFCRTRDLVE